MSAKSIWTRLDGLRQGSLDRARQSAELTVPSLMPPEGSTEHTALNSPNQSLGARGVNNLASRLLLALMPPGNAFFRLLMSQKTEQELADAGVERAAVEEGLRDIENSVMRRVERSNLRTVLFGVLRHLVTCGNALLYVPKSGDNQMYPLDKYVVVRDPAGTLLELIVKETVDPSTLPPEAQALLTARTQEGEHDRPVGLYKHVRLEGGKHKWHEEVEDQLIPGSEGEAPVGTSPWIALRWSSISGENYGRGMVEEYIGDLRTLEGLSQAIISFAAIAAKMHPLLSPNSTITPEDLQQPSGTVIIGDKDDVSMFQADKFPDFQVVSGTVDRIELRLSHDFLLRSGTVRDAERVTAEEIRQQAQELEDVLGGTYTVLAREMQLPLVHRFMALARASGEIPALPDGSLEPTVVTGFDALGRGHELNRLRSFLSDAISLFGAQALEAIDTEDGLQKLATMHNADVRLRSKEDIEEARRQQEATAMAQSAAPGVASEVAKSMTQPDN